MCPKSLSAFVPKLFLNLMDTVNGVNITVVTIVILIISNTDRWFAQSPLKLCYPLSKHSLLALDQMDTQDKSKRFGKGSIWHANPKCISVFCQGFLFKY